jgi:serine/threonine-protein kinase
MADDRLDEHQSVNLVADGEQFEPDITRVVAYRKRETPRLGVYQLDGRIGEGGMADVWAAWAPDADSQGATRVAIKRIRSELASNTSYKIMFCEEAHVGALLSEHPNIVRLIDFDVVQREPFMVFEYVDGLSVSRLMRLSWVRKKTMPAAAALFIAQQTLIALDFAHHAVDESGAPIGIVHRDVSPENILVSRTGDVKLTDFGIVRTRGASRLSRNTAPGGLKGKLGYMSPEQIAGGEVDARSDLFSLGIVLAEMLTHAPLFRGLNELELLTRMYQVELGNLEGSALTPELHGLLMRALAPRPDRRFQSARSFRAAIECVAASLKLELNEHVLEQWFAELDVVVRQSGTFRLGDSGGARKKTKLLRRIELAREAFASCVGGSAAAVQEPAAVLPAPLGDVSQPHVGAGGSRAGQAVRSNGGPPLRSFPREASASNVVDPAAAFQFGSPMLANADWVRPLRRGELVGVLCDLILRRQTGLLRVCCERREKRLYFADGALEFIASTERDELLGQRLVASGMLRQADLERALNSALVQQCRLGQALVGQRMLPAHVVLRALIAQLEARFRELGNWHEGRVAFFRGERPGVASVRVQAAAMELVFDLVRQAYSVAELRGVLSPVSERPLRKASTGDAAGAALPFSDAERRALAMVDDGQRLNALVAHLAAHPGIAPVEAYRAVFLALSSGILVTGGRTAPNTKKPRGPNA